MESSKRVQSSSTTTTLSELSKHHHPYPSRQNRYSRYGWNANSQACYNACDTSLLQKIQHEYAKLGQQDQDKPFFSTIQETAWYDFWSCDKPTLGGKLISFAEKSFTLPNRLTKDTKAFPLWDFADRMARQIANWQAERAAHSNADVINDPTMLVFEELRDWFFRVLVEREGKVEDLHFITQRQSYINNLIHLLPDFGRDRLHLHQIQHSLDDARNIVLATIANRELPQLLTGMIIDAINLENTIGTYLHFLGINEPVDDNYSPSCLESSDTICKISPVRKVYDAAKSAILATTQPSQQVARYQNQHSLYAMSPVKENNGIITIQPTLRTDAANGIQFATFVTDIDKKNYVEALAILESLTQVRKTLENFQNVQSSIGTYFFAYSYLDKTSQLATNYNALVMKASTLLSKLIQTSDNGLRQLLADDSHQRKNANNFFETNLRKLQTRVVNDTTLKNQLETFSKKAMHSMNIYNGKMEELVTDLKSGKASDEVRRAMQELYIQLSDLNNMLTVVLNDEQLMIDMNLANNCAGMPFDNECTNQELAITDSQFDEHKTTSTESTANDETPAANSINQTVMTAIYSAGYGSMRGISNVLGNALQSRGYSQQFANFTSQLSYYSMYFTSKLYAHYDPQQNNDDIFLALQQSAFETGQLWLVSTVLNQTGQYLQSAGDYLQKNNWQYTGSGLKKLGGLAHFGMFAMTAATNGPVDVAVGFTAGMASEVVTERIGNAIFC